MILPRNTKTYAT